MTYYERYLNGETEAVYEEILSLGNKAFQPTIFADIEKVLIETFQRVAYNLEILYEELNKIDYLFKTQFEGNFERPLHKPLPDTGSLLQQLDKAVEPFGFVPISLKYFYKIVGGVNFVWDYETNDEIRWPVADPIQIVSLDGLVSMISDDDWQEDIRQYVDDEDYGFAFLELAADDLHKDNVSGGPPYSLKITQEPSIDSDLINEPNNTTFIDYLRICFENCGFPGITNPEDEQGFREFYDKLKPQMKKI
ncbi:hypothetical protein Q0590_37100 [Rhodocytophaga aerolata]|uniref:SMI1/KNR4 family protein n=1 Tax=Rhodocytophaga aerolata TaxID=455078 RepID=A0ABT8RJG1_9BACT|nr:hypothetical protein [Rhodocytophaga aerolata]MDO1451946.1 hypothetical protein [Rhodocytophaga aerolata]